MERRVILNDAPASSSLTTLHDRDARLPVSGDDGTVHRRRSTPARQERRVHVNHAERRDAEQLVGQELAVGRHDAEVRRESRDLAEKGRVFQSLRLQNRDSARQRQRFRRRRCQVMAAPFRPIGLRDERDDVMCSRRVGPPRSPPRSSEPLKRRHRKLRRAEVDDAQPLSRAGSHHRPLRFSF